MANDTSGYSDVGSAPPKKQPGKRPPKGRRFSDYMNQRTVGGGGGATSANTSAGGATQTGGTVYSAGTSKQSSGRGENRPSGFSPTDVAGRSSRDMASNYRPYDPNAPRRDDSTGDAAVGGTDDIYGNSRLARAVEEGKYGDAWANPDQLAALWFNQGKYNPYGAGYATVQDMAQQAPLMWLLMSPTADLYGGTPSYMDYFQSYLNRATGPGALPHSYDILNAIFNADEGSAAAQMLHNPLLTANDQIGNLISTVETALGGYLPTPVLQMMLDDMAYQGQQWGAGLMGKPLGKKTFADYYLGKSPIAPF